jgi:hypothetical protein
MTQRPLARTVLITALSAAMALGVTACGTGTTPLAGGLKTPGPTATPTSTPTTAPTSPAGPTGSAPASGPPGSAAPSQRAALPPGWTDLGDATVTLPSWGGDGPCPTGPVALTHGYFPLDAGGFDDRDGLTTVVAVDLDGDGRSEAVALIECHRSDPGIEQVVAFAHDASGQIQTLGIVVGPGLHDGPATIEGILADSSGITAYVSNLAGSDGSADEAQVVQARTYGYLAGTFVQTGGPTSFTRTATVTGTAGDLVFGPVSGGRRTGTMTVTVHNTGPTALSDLSVLAGPGDTSLEPVAAAACPLGPANSVLTCPISSLAAGASRTVTFTFRGDPVVIAGLLADGGLAGAGFVLQLRIGEQRVTPDPTLGKLRA